MHGLERLNLSNTKISGNSLAVISSSFPVLKTLTLSGCALKDSDLSRLKGLSVLERLECQSANLTDQAILELQRFPQLKILSLDYNRITGETLGALVRQPRLANLGLCGTQLTSSGLANLRSKSIESLDISSTEVDEHAVPFLRTLTNLKHLDHKGCGFLIAGPLPGQTNEFVISLPSALPADIASRDIGLTKDKRSREELELALTHANLSLAKDKNPYNYQTRGRVLFTLGGYSEAVADLNIVIDDLQHPKGYICSKIAGAYTTSLFLAILTRAHAQNALGHYQEALTDASMAVSLNRLSSQARKEAGYAGLKLGKFTDSLKQLSRGVEINPKSAELHKYKAEVLKKLGREAEAAKEFELADKLGFVSEYP